MNTPKANRAIASEMGGEARRVQADAFAAAILPAIVQARAAGATSYQEVADALNARGIPTARGRRWNRVQVRRIEVRIPR